MKCDLCGQNEATIHLSHWRDGRLEERHLCPACAGSDAAAGEGADDGNSRRLPRSPLDGEADSLASFLGSVLGEGDSPREEDPPACPVCGYTLVQLQETNRLGCPACFQVFREQLLPMLARFHGHVTHLGRTPRQGGEHPSVLGEISRTRVALEKAIAAEQFEEAARLRDRIRQLEGSRDGEAETEHE